MANEHSQESVARRRAVTVAICTFNRATVLRKTLEQLVALQIPNDVDWELLVVDNNSTDATPEVLRTMASRLPIRSCQEVRRGQSYARNLVLREARGEFILWTDDDVLVDVNWLTNVLSAFDKTGADFVFGRASAAWPSGVTPRWYSPRVNGLFALLDYGPHSFVAVNKDTPFYGLNFAGRCSAHRQLGGFREDYGVRGHQGGGGLGEDLEMYERALAHHLKIVYQPNAIVLHVIPAERSTRLFNWKKALFHQRRFYDELIRHPPTVPWLLGLPRFYYRMMLNDTFGMLRSLVSRRPAERFFYELQMLQFAGRFAQACRRGFRTPLQPLAKSASNAALRPRE